MTHPHSRRRPVGTIGALALAVIAALAFASSAGAATSPVGLGTAASFAVLGGQSVTNTGPSTIGGDLGVSPGTSITGFPPGTVFGTTHQTDAAAAQAQQDLTTAYIDAAGRPGGASVSADLGGQTLTPGVYNSGSAMGLTGTLTLDAQGDPNAVFIFQMGSTLTTASASSVKLINAASSCNVFWQVGSSATLGTNSTFRGTVMALTSIAVQTGATIDGRALARNGSVTLDNNPITASICAAATTTGSTATTAQVARTPVGGVQTGGGSTSGVQHRGLLALGAGLLIAAGFAGAVRRSMTQSD
ncbi:MAG: ice-binding family protein [Acidimicrobiales bacterium]